MRWAVWYRTEDTRGHARENKVYFTDRKLEAETSTQRATEERWQVVKRQGGKHQARAFTGVSVAKARPVG